MMMMTAKVNTKKILIALAATAALIAALVLTLGKGDSDPAAVTTMSDNNHRVEFLQSQGWQVTETPKEASQVRIPTEQTPVYARYNELQKTQGYDLAPYAGKTVMRYVYQINNYPGATEPVYATLLIYKNQVIGGDVTNTAAKGVIQGFAMSGQGQSATAPSTVPPTDAPDNHTTKTNP